AAETDASKKQKLVTLYSDWTAISNSSYTTVFQQTTPAGQTFGTIYHGAARVASGVSILLNMNGYTMNRNLTAARAEGSVIWLDGGNLEIIDEADPLLHKAGGKGTIRGGYSSNSGSAIHFTGGTLKIHDVDIINNYSATGAIYMASALPFTIGGSVQIYNNRATNSSSAAMRNVYMYNAASMIKIDEKLTGGQKISVYRSGRGVFTDGFGENNAGVEAKSLFSSENEPLYVVENNGTGTEMEAEQWCYDNSLNWTYFVGQSLANNGAVQKMPLYSNWTAVSNSSYATAFSTDSYFYQGAIYCPAGANIELDLNGYTINRALTSSTGRNHGYVFRVNGNLTITDSSSTNAGMITGGWNIYSNTNYGGGAFSVINGTLTLLGGKVTNSRGIYGGILLTGSARLNLGKNAQIYNNYTTAGAACNIYQYNTPAAAINVVAAFTGKSFTGGQLFGITRLANGTFTSGFETYHPNEEAATYFKSENSNYFVFTDNASGKNEAAMSSYVGSTNWEYAVTTSLANSARPETAKLYSAWNATANNSSGFGTVSNCYTGGALYVPAGANVILDLSGYTLNRNCSSAISNGYVIYVAGTLTIRDTSAAKAGRITGGYNSSSTSTGGIYIASGGVVNFESGNIVSNRYTGTNGGAALHMRNNSTFNMTGGSIYSNSVPTSTTSAGVLFAYYYTNVTVRITGGNIYNNSTVNNTAYASGIHLTGTVNFELGGSARIYNNSYGSITRNIYHATNDAKYKIVEDIEPTFYVGVTKTTNNYAAGTTKGLVFTTDWGTHYKSTSTGGKFFADENAVYCVIDNNEGSQTEQALWTISNAKNWQEAYAASAAETDASKKQKLVTLYSDWTAI
ncbi:MAG: hypothetical protein K2H43_00080, partial [Clostridia bacterium]|nr:hypothetical protein [Clostridia bacterium]